MGIQLESSVDPIFDGKQKELSNTKSNSDADFISTSKSGQVDFLSKDDIYANKGYLNIVQQTSNSTDTCTYAESDSFSSSCDDDSSNGDGAMRRSEEKNIKVHEVELGSNGSPSSERVEMCEDVSNRLYNRSALKQKQGKERRKEIFLRSKARKDKENSVFCGRSLPTCRNDNMYYKGIHFMIEREQKRIAIANSNDMEYHSETLSKLQCSFNAKR